MNNPTLAIIIGMLNLDVVITGLPKFAPHGEQVNGQSVKLLPGGKGRNLATMLAAWLAPGEVSMVSKLVKDRYGLYRIPLQSLIEAGIQIDEVRIEADRPEDLPTLAIFLNTIEGLRANYYLPGRNETLSPEDLEGVQPLFKQVAENKGYLLMTLELPLATACYVLGEAAALGLRVMLDPGGQPPEEDVDFSPLFEHPPFLIKPNEAEASRLTGIEVYDFASAERAARILMDQGVGYVLITHGGYGAYAFTREHGWHISSPSLPVPPHAEPTGCGDQVLAVLCAEMLHGKSFEESCHKAVRAGTLQYCQLGLAPIRPDHPLL